MLTTVGNTHVILGHNFTKLAFDTDVSTVGYLRGVFCWWSSVSFKGNLGNVLFRGHMEASPGEIASVLLEVVVPRHDQSSRATVGMAHEDFLHAART